MTVPNVCRLWVQTADSAVTVRADRIVALRCVRLAPIGASPYRWRLDLVVCDPSGDGDSQVVPLCIGLGETFDDDAPRELLALIARHLDDPGGGLIDAANEDVAEELEHVGLGGLFRYTAFVDLDSKKPRPVR